MAVRALQIVGLLLWRGGLALAAGTALVISVRFVLRFVRLPVPLEVGVALLVSGFLLVLVSMILERVGDARAEGRDRCPGDRGGGGGAGP